VFCSVARELARFLGVYVSALLRYQADQSALLLAARDEAGVINMPVGEEFSPEGDNLAAMARCTGRPARIVYQDASGPTAARMRGLGIRTAVGVPIHVAGRLWGAAIVGWSQPELLRSDTEARVADFADFVATAISNAQTRTELTADDARRRLERDLHDGAQQRLISLALELRAAQEALARRSALGQEQIAGLARGLADA
jgi:transcriptional regulator with GAF, ATPase, and Fis domain